MPEIGKIGFQMKSEKSDFELYLDFDQILTSLYHFISCRGKWYRKVVQRNILIILKFFAALYHFTTCTTLFDLAPIRVCVKCV